MQSLLELFDREEERFSKIGAKNLYKLKYVFDSTSEDYEKMKFELKTIFKLIDRLEPKEMKVMIDNVFKKIEKLEFNPTISGPNIVLKDRLGRHFSVWYKPCFYIPSTASARELLLDFVIMRGMENSMYDFDPDFKKELYSYEFFSDSLLREVSIKLLSKMKRIHLAVFCKRKFMPSDLRDLKAAAFFLKPNKVLIVSEDYLPDVLKMSLPVNVVYSENIGMNQDKFAEFASRLL